MIRRLFCISLALLLVGFSSPLGAVTSRKPSDKSESAKVTAAASALAAVTGIAISPLLGTGVYGAYKYISTPEEQRSTLPWFAMPGFFIPALIIAGLCAAKDTFGVVFPPGMKKPLDIAELLENKLSGLIAAGAVIPITMSGLSKILVDTAGTPHAAIFPHDLAMISLGTIHASWLIDLVTIPLGIFVFAVVWMASHAINVLILLSPWGAIDAALKAARVSLLGLITLTAQLDPKNAAVLCIIVIVVAYCVAGWSFRLTVFGTLSCWDFFTGRRRRFSTDPISNRVFSSTALTEQKIPIRTYGHLVKTGKGRHVFRYRPWLMLPEKTIEMTDAKIVIGRGIFFSTIMAGDRPLFIMPPRYIGHETQVAQTYGFAGVQDAGLRKAWSWLREAFGGKAQPALPA